MQGVRKEEELGKGKHSETIPASSETPPSPSGANVVLQGHSALDQNSWVHVLCSHWMWAAKKVHDLG